MDGVKVIDISSMSSNKNKKLTKKQMYKQILSSSDTVKEIINNRKKTCRFNYLNTIPKLQSEPNSSQIKKQPVKTKPVEVTPKPVEVTPKPVEVTPKPVEVTPKPVENKFMPIIDNNNKTQMKINRYFKIQAKAYESKKQKKKSVTFSNKVKVLNVDKKTNVNKINKFGNIETKQIKLNRQPKKFTEKHILEIINILLKLNKLDQYNKIHKTIRRINKLQINQLLFALRLIKKYSNAPENMLKNTLFNYITGSIKITRD
jgi:hypothetical protein